MPQRDWLILLGVGFLFLLLGIGSIVWGTSEEKSYYSSISTRPDVREFLERLPWRPEPGALRIGGRIAVAIGLLLLIIGGVLWLIHAIS